MDLTTMTVTLLLLFAAALLEAGGDALVRQGLQTSTMMLRLSLFAAGGVVLFAYGYVVNTPSWTFGRLLGVYIVFFFVIAQFISWVVFQQRPTTAILVGGAFIAAGGIIISYP
jgi:drug/metabolite transporter superfamily protein YnfA